MGDNDIIRRPPSKATKQQKSKNSMQGKMPDGVALCAGKNRNDMPCNNVAGKGTDHFGVGRCFWHGGNLQHEGRGQLAFNSFTQMAEYPGIKEKAERLARERDVFDLRDHIFLFEAIMMTVLERAKTMEDLGAVIKYGEMAIKSIKTLDEIEHARRLVIDIQGVNVILAKVQQAITRYVSDSYTKDLIAKEIATITVNQQADEPLLLEGDLINEN